MDRQPVRVTIYHQNFSVLAQGDPADLQRAADTVDGLMQSIAAKSPTADTVRIALLACLHLADKLHALEDKTEEIGEILDRAMGED